jgi:hypothetical protein
MKRVVLLLIAGFALAAACATATTLPPTASQCGNACAPGTCPSAFACYVDARCVPRCQPESIKPGFP